MWASVRAAEPEPKPAPASPAASSNATNPVASFIIKPGFRIELVAAEPAVVAPVAMAFDENGRLFVAEMRDYPNRRDTSPHLGRIRLLEDPEGEGLFSESTVYAEDLAWPSALACYEGGVFVAAAPDIIFFKDTRTNGTADIRHLVLSGFGGKNPDNAELLPNNFNWGLDQRIHGASAGIGGTIAAPGAGLSPVSLARSDFAFDPRTLEVLPEAGPSLSGLSFDNQGRRFTSDFSRPLRMPMYDRHYMLRNPFFPKPPEMIDVASDATPIYRFLSPESVSALERRRSTGPARERFTSPIATTWLAMARGFALYRGNVFPTNYLDNAFIPDPGAHVIHREILRDNGLEVSTERAKDEKATEFLMSRDPAFQPVQVLNGPDGALYVADFHGGGDQGRIYRIVPVQFRQPKPQRLGKADTYQLVATLAHANGWHRETAARLLYERHDLSAAPLLADIAGSSRLLLARLGALNMSDALGVITDKQVLKALKDSDPRVRALGVQFCERLLTNGIPSNDVWSQLSGMTADPSVRVRYQLAFTLGQIQRPERTALLARLLLQDSENTYLRAAILSSLAEGSGQVVATLARTPQVRTTAAGQALLRQLATMVGCSGQVDEVNQVLNFILRTGTDDLQTFGLLSALGDGLLRTRSSLALVDPQARLQPLYDLAVTDSLAPGTSESLRVAAIRLLGVSPYSYAYTNIGPWIIALLDSGASQTVQSAVIASLGQFDDPSIATNLLFRWRLFSPALRNQALTALLTRNNRINDVLTALEIGVISKADVSPIQQNFLRSSANPSLRQRALAVFGPVPLQRPDVVRQYRPSLELRGVASQGRGIFLARCAACHVFAGDGKRVGPALDGLRVSGREKILSAILEPNVAVRPDYQTTILQTSSGQNFVGIIQDDNPSAVTLVQPEGVQLVWPRTGIVGSPSQTWSLMPDGLEKGLTTQNMADLLEYLMAGP